MIGPAGERDARLIYAAGFVRSATVSLVGVTLAIHLAEVGFSTTQIGLLIGVGLAGSSLATVIVSLRGDAWGRRRVLVGLALLSASGYLALAAFTNAARPRAARVRRDAEWHGPRSRRRIRAHQAILPVTVSDDRRTWALAWYNLVLDGGHALGALAATIPTVLCAPPWSPRCSAPLTFLVCAGAMVLCIVPYLA